MRHDPGVSSPRGSVEVRERFVTVHGHQRAYRLAGPEPGTGPAVLLVHGVGDSSRTWKEVLPLLGQRRTIIAPDLLGHGASDKPRADYSVGGFANGMRDLLLLLGIDRVTVVGQSLGGGIAQQFAYQYPELCERLVLVASGGLGSDVTPLLRLAALPGAGPVIRLSALPPVRLYFFQLPGCIPGTRSRVVPIQNLKRIKNDTAQIRYCHQW